MKNKTNIIYLFILITIVILMLFIPYKVNATYTLTELRNMYPTGMQWNDSYYGSIECHGFAGLIYSSYYGINPFQYAEKVTDVEQLQPGDMIRYNGHTVFILTRNGETTTVVECNYDWNNHVRWDQTKTMSEFRNNFQYILKAPYVLGTTPNPPETPTNVSVDTSFGVKVSWNKANYCYGYKVEIYNTSNEKVKEVEIKKASTTSTNIYSLATGTYTARVYSIGVDDTLSGYSSSTSFSCLEEASNYTISPEKNVIEIGESFNHSITFTPTNGIAQTKIYAGDNTDQSIIKVETDGTITGLKEGTTVVYFEFKTSRTTRTKALEVKVVTPVKFAETAKLLNVGETCTIDLISKSSEADLNWYSNNKKVATVDSSGNITAIAAGTAKISASQTIYNSDKSDYTIVIDYCTITVKEPTIEVSEVCLNKMNITLAEGETESLTATILPSNATDKNITWISSNTNVAIVDNNGQITAISDGIATITATSSNGKKANCIVNVEKIDIVKFNQNTLNLTKGNSTTLEIVEGLSSTSTLTWKVKSMSDETIEYDITNEEITDYIKVETTDNKNVINITAVDAEKANNKYQVIAYVDEKYIGICNITINVPIESIKIYPNTIGLSVSGTFAEKSSTTIDYQNEALREFKLRVQVYPNNATETLSEVEWIVGNPKILQNNQDGSFKILRGGETDVTAIAGEYQRIITITIINDDEHLLKGDVNYDGEVKLYDALQILKQAILGGDLTEDELYIMDYNDDKQVTLYDSLKFLQQAILG